LCMLLSTSFVITSGQPAAVDVCATSGRYTPFAMASKFSSGSAA
jgi:hypothetical protein